MICLAGCDKTIPGVTMALPRLNAVSVQDNVMATCTYFIKRHQYGLHVIRKNVEPCSTGTLASPTTN